MKTRTRRLIAPLRALRRLPTLLWLLAGVSLSATPGPQATPVDDDRDSPPQDASTPLAPDSVVSRAGRAGDVHRYTVDLLAGDFFEVRVSQNESASRLAIGGSNGNALRAIDMIDLPPQDERLMLIASEAGRYGVDLELGRHSADDQRYTLRVVALRPATERDRARDGCFALTVEADRLAHIQRLDSLGESIGLLEQATSCWHDVEDRGLETATLTSLGSISALFGQFSAQSIAAYARLVDIYSESGDQEQELTSLQSLIREYADYGRFDKALEGAMRARRLAADIGSRPKEARALHNVALAALFVGDYQQAREAATAALALAAEVRDPTVRALASYDLGRLDALAGDFDAARTRYEQALQTSSPDRSVTSIVTLHLGLLHLERREYEEAEKRLTERLRLSARFVQREQEAFARLGLGDVQMARGDRDGATELYRAARDALARSFSVHRCIAEERLGRLDLDDGRLDEAEGRFREMLAIGDRTGYLPCTAQGRAAIADLSVLRGDLAAADIEARQVIDLNERFREAVPNLESRALGFGALAPAFERAVDINMRLAARGDPAAAARAFELNERGLARGLLDQISAAAIDGRAEIPQAVAREWQDARREWRASLAQLQIATRTPDNRDRPDALLTEINALEVKIRDLEARADEADTRRARLVRPRALDIQQIRAVLDTGTTLLEYGLGERESYLWVVSSSDLHVFRLGPRAPIEAAARRVYEDATSPSSASQPAARERRLALTTLILAPAAPLLTSRRIVVVAAGALSLVPFGALPVPGQSPRAPMVSRYEIVHLPSATTLAAMRASSDRRVPPTKTAVVLADPIFEAADPRVQNGAPAGGSSRASLSRGSAAPPTRDTAAQTIAALGRTFPRLPFSRVEARAIDSMVPGHATILVDGEATRDRVLGRALGDYRFVHFATHGIVHPEIASLSSIVLSLVDDKGVAHDPFVTLSDIYEMRLNADVVVLSACSTATGKNVPGEGPIGLARAFMYAGAPRVVASLWQVNDNATAELMKRFYRGMLVDDLPPAAALRRAQRELAAIPRWASPYFWAPFVLQGDWRSLETR